MERKTITILLLEDELAYAELVRLVFADVCPFVQLIHVQDGLAGLAFLHQEDAPRPRLILCDVNMPKMDGIHFLQMIKADESLRDIPVLMLSGSDAPQDVRNCYYHHAAAYILKTGDLYAFSAKMADMMSYWLEVACLPEGDA